MVHAPAPVAGTPTAPPLVVGPPQRAPALPAPPPPAAESQHAVEASATVACLPRKRLSLSFSSSLSPLLSLQAPRSPDKASARHRSPNHVCFRPASSGCPRSGAVIHHARSPPVPRVSSSLAPPLPSHSFFSHTRPLTLSCLWPLCPSPLTPPPPPRPPLPRSRPTSASTPRPRLAPHARKWVRASG